MIAIASLLPHAWRSSQLVGSLLAAFVAEQKSVDHSGKLLRFVPHQEPASWSSAVALHDLSAEAPSSALPRAAAARTIPRPSATHAGLSPLVASDHLSRADRSAAPDFDSDSDPERPIGTGARWATSRSAAGRVSLMLLWGSDHRDGMPGSSWNLGARAPRAAGETVQETSAACRRREPLPRPRSAVAPAERLAVGTPSSAATGRAPEPVALATRSHAQGAQSVNSRFRSRLRRPSRA
jgi:hypothetical protein